MDQLPYDNLEQLSEYVKATYSGNNDQQRTATEVFHRMGEDHIRFVNSMLNLVIADLPANEATFNLKRATCVLIPTILTLHEKVVLANPKPLLDMLLEVFFSDKIPFTLKPSMSPVFLLFYSTDTNGDLRKEGLNIIKDKLTNGSVNEYYAALFIMQTIVNCSKLTQKTAANWFQHLLEALVKSGSAIVNGIILEIQETIKGAEQSSKINNIIVGGTVLKLWMDMINMFTQMLGKTEPLKPFNPGYIAFMMVQEHILEILKRTLILHIPTDKQVSGCILSTCGVVKVDELFNSIKTQVLEWFNTLMDYMQCHPGGFKDLNLNKFYQYTRAEGVKLIMDSCYRFCKTEVIDVEKALDDGLYLSGCLVEALKLLTKLSSQKDLYNIFSTYRNHLVMDVCLPLIRCSAQEIADFEDEPDQFVQLALDTCQKQVSETPKTQAAQLIEQMCTHIDGVLSYTVVMLLQLVDFSLISNDLAAIPEKFPRLVDYQNSVIITKTDHITRVESSLVVLANIGYLVVIRPDLMEIIERVFGEYHEYFLGDKPTPIIQSRLCLFLGFYLGSIFTAEDKKTLFQGYLEYLITCAGMAGQEVDAVAEQAHHSLSLIFDSTKVTYERLAPFIGDILAKLTTYIKYVMSDQFFDLLLEIFKVYEGPLKENQTLMFAVLKELVDRTQEEYISVKDAPKESHYTLARLWHIIHEIAETKDLVLRYQDQLEALLTPLIAYMETEEKLPFEEDILSYMASVIKIRREVTPLMWTIFKLFPKIFVKHENTIWHLFAPLNQLIIHGKEYLSNNPETQQIIIEMGIEGLNPKSKSANSANVSEACLLLQLCIQYLTLTNEVWEKILIACLEKLKTIEKGFLLARIGEVFLLAFLTNFQLTQAIVVNQGAAGYLIDNFLKNVLKYETHPYDRKVLLICLTNFVHQSELHDEIKQRLPAILSVLIPVFKYVELIEQIELGKAKTNPDPDDDDDEYVHRTADPEFLKEFLRGSDVDKQDVPKNLFQNIVLNRKAEEEHKDDDDDDDDEYRGNDMVVVITAENESNKVLDKFETEFKTQDEFAFFRKVILQMKASSPDVLEELYNSLEPHMRNYFKDILHSQRVTLDEGEGKTQARKIVKTKARKVATIEFPNNNQ